MTKYKQNIKNIILIVTVIFIILPILFELYKLLSYKEGYENCKFDSNDNKKIDRIDLNGVVLPTNSDTSYNGVEGEYLYCPAGKITCSNGNTPTEKEDYSLNGEVVGKTYSFDCSSGTNSDWKVGSPHVKCDNYYSKKEPDATKFYYSDVSHNYTKWYKNPNNADDPSFNINSETVKLSGFIGPYNYIPMSISGDENDSEALKIYNTSQNIYFSATPCFLYNSREYCENDCYNFDKDCSNVDCSDVDCKDLNCDVPDPSLKCIADYGTEVGQKLCCGQDGYVKGTKHICPSEYPYCKGYKCGESWGKCHGSTEK
tara:strand:- start:5674 stop:6615 length:942 start_codon:yes stop_codon:yes gene_type:complete